MNPFEWRRKAWYHQAISLLTIVLVVVLAAHPELRLLLPLVDALGLDLLLLLIGAQSLAFAMPLLHSAHHALIRPAAAWLHWLAMLLLGVMGPYVEARVSALRGPRGDPDVGPVPCVEGAGDARVSAAGPSESPWP